MRKRSQDRQYRNKESKLKSVESEADMLRTQPTHSDIIKSRSLLDELKEPGLLTNSYVWTWNYTVIEREDGRNLK